MRTNQPLQGIIRPLLWLAGGYAASCLLLAAELCGRRDTCQTDTLSCWDGMGSGDSHKPVALSSGSSSDLYIIFVTRALASLANQREACACNGRLCSIVWVGLPNASKSFSYRGAWIHLYRYISAVNGANRTANLHDIHPPTYMTSTPITKGLTRENKERQA